MEAKLAAMKHLMSPGVSRRDNMPNRRYSPYNILSVMAKPTNTSLTTSNGASDYYKDNWFDRIAINHLSNSLQATIGNSFVPPFT